MTPGVTPLLLTPSVNTKIHRVPPQSNLHGHRLSTLSKTIGLLTLQHCCHENVQTQWPRSLCLSAMNLYRRQRRMFYGRLGSHSYLKPIPTSASWTHSHPSLSRVRKLVFRATLSVELNVLITHLRSNILRSSASQFKKSRISRSITSAPQSASSLSKRITGWRVIFDLSSPEGASVNDGIPKEYGTLVYETLNDAIQLIAQAGRGAVMMKRDLKAAFRHVPINPCDYWLLLFEWNGQFFVDMFLPFGLRTAPRIFNLFAEALHWIFETLHEWNVTHYLDDFLFVFPPNTDITAISAQFDHVLAEFGLTKASEKDSDGCVVVHLGFEFDSENMQVRLPPNKKQRALDAVNILLSSSTVTYTMLETTLGFLSHCCQVIPLGRPFLRNLFSQICRSNSRSHLLRFPLTHDSKNDLRWWLQFLTSWSSISMIQLSRISYDVATDASGAKGMGGVYNRLVFSE